MQTEDLAWDDLMATIDGHGMKYLLLQRERKIHQRTRTRVDTVHRRLSTETYVRHDITGEQTILLMFDCCLFQLRVACSSMHSMVSL